MSVINLKSSRFDNISQLLYFVQEELTLCDFQRDACCSQALKNFVDLLDVFFDGIRVNDYVIKLDKAHLPFVLFKDDVKSTLKRRRCVFKAKTHANILISSRMRNNRCLWSIFFSNIYHPVARVNINRRKRSRLSQ